jgi:hypothetical protein
MHRAASTLYGYESPSERMQMTDDHTDVEVRQDELVYTVGPAGAPSIDECDAPRHFLEPITVRRKDARAAPKCFGSPALRDPESSDCARCRYFEGCAIVGEQQRQRIRDGFRLLGRELRSSSSTRPIALMQLIRRLYLGQARSGRERKKRRDRLAKELQRQLAENRIEVEFGRRLRLLQRSIEVGASGKRGEQLRGREMDITIAWKARQLALLQHGSQPSDAQVACILRSLCPARRYSRHQARSDRQLIAKLEQAGGAWWLIAK